MKIKILALVLFFSSIEAISKTQVLILGNEATPITLNVGAKMDMGGYSISKTDHGMGLKSLGLSLGFAHYVADFEYGMNLFGAWATSTGGKLFSENSQYDGFKTEITLNGRYMPLISKNVRLGGILSLSYSRLFGEGHKSFHEAFLGDFNFDVGPSFMYQGQSFSWGMGLTFGLNEIRFGGQTAHARLKQYSNFQVVRLPIEFLVDATDTVGLSFAFEPGWRNLGGNHKFYHGIFL